jgi:hypothetical protein
MKVVLWATTLYLAASVVTTFFIDIFICFPIENNWSLDPDKQALSMWNSYADFVANWTLNIIADFLRMLTVSATSDAINTNVSSLPVFFIPFFIIKNLKLRQRQKIGLVGVFSLGIITMAISFTRFVLFTVSDYSLGDNAGGKHIEDKK